MFSYLDSSKAAKSIFNVKDNGCHSNTNREMDGPKSGTILAVSHIRVESPTEQWSTEQQPPGQEQPIILSDSQAYIQGQVQYSTMQKT